MDQDAPVKPREQKVTLQRTRWKILLFMLFLLHGSSTTPPHKQPHSGGLQASSLPSRTHLCSMETHASSTPPCCWKNSFTGANGLRGPRLVSGETGGAVTIQCHYAPSPVNRHQRKYWCHLRPPLWTCYTIVSSKHYTHRDYSGRVALTDFPRSGLFVVKLSRLSLDDMGLYRCGIGDRNDMLFFSMNLIVSAGPSNATYAAAPASGEPIPASPGRASAAANRWTAGVTQILEWHRTAPTTGISKTTPSASRIQTPTTVKTTVPGTISRKESSVKGTFSTPESPVSKPRRTFSTTQGVWIWSTGNSETNGTNTSEDRKRGTTPEAGGPQEKTEVSMSPDTPRKTTGVTRPSILTSEHVTWETLQEGTAVSKQRALYSMEESSPAPSAWTLNTTYLEVASGEGSTDGNLEHTATESPPTPSQLSAVGTIWASGKGSSMKSAFTDEEESNSWILTPVSTVLALVLLVALVLLKGRLWRKRISREAERAPRITLIQMTHCLPDKLPDVGMNLQQDDLPPIQASLTVMGRDPGP